MIQFTGNTKVKAEPVRRESKEGKTWAFGLMCKCAVMLVMIFSACGLRVYFSDRTEKLERRALRLKQEIRETDREIQNLIARRERMVTLEYIQSKIAEYKMDLRPTAAAQVRYLKYYHVSPDVRERERREVAEAEKGRTEANPYRTASAR